MGPMPIEDKKDKINSKLNTIYYKVIDSKDRKAFLKNLEQEFNKSSKNYKDLLNDEEIKIYYELLKNELANRFEQYKQFKNIDIRKDIDIIDKKLNMKFRTILKSKDEDEFKKKYNEFKEEILKDYNDGDKKEELSNFIDFWINNKVEEFKIEKDKQKKEYISNFLNSNYNDLKDSKNSEKELEDAINEKKNGDNILVEYLKDKNYDELYKKNMNDKKLMFKRELTNRNEIQKTTLEKKCEEFFNNKVRYKDVLKLSNDEETFKSEYKKQLELVPELNNNYDKFKEYYNKLLDNKLRAFRVDLAQKTKKETSEIENDLYKFFNDKYEQICKDSSKEDEFRTKFDEERKTRTELNKYFQNGYCSQYNRLLDDYAKKFNTYLKEKEKSDKTLMKNKYLKFLDDNYVKVSKDSFTVEEFESKYTEKLNETKYKELKEKKSEFEGDYKVALESKKSQFQIEIENRIKTAYNNYYYDAMKKSKDESEFKINLKNLLLDDKIVKKPLEKEEYKKYFDGLHNSEKIKNDLKDNLILQTTSFFYDNYEIIRDDSKDISEFENKIKAKASVAIQKSENFELLLTKYKKLFEKDKKEEREEKNKKEKLSEYQKQEKKLIDDFMNNIDTKQFEDSGSINYFKNFDQSKFDTLFQSLFVEENYDKKIEKKIDLYINELLNDKNKKVNHLNILLCGNSGAGKSTLINGFLELEGPNKLPTGTGEAVTMETKYISSPKIPIFRLGDSRGIEISKEGPKSYGISEVVKNMNEFIQYQLETKNPDNYVHCIWYCVIPLDGRFNKVIGECLNELADNYGIKGLPIIIVGTKAISNQANIELDKYIKDQKTKYPFHPVLAMKDGDKEPFGLEELKVLSLNKALDGIESSCYQGIIKNIIETSKIKVENQKKIIDEKIKQKNEQVFKNIESNPKFENLKQILSETFIIILKQYSSINLSNTNNNIEEIKLGTKSKNEIDKFINDYYIYCKKNYEQNYEKIIESRTLELVNKIIKEKTDFIYSNLVIVESKSEDKLKEEIGKKIKDKLKEKSDIYYFKNLYIELIKLLIETFEIYFINSFDIMIKAKENEENTKRLIISKISEQFKELKRKIEEYNKKKKEENGRARGANEFLAKRMAGGGK